MKKNFTCIVCPMSCSLEVEDIEGEVVVKGNTCNRGKEFGKNEFVSPKRMLTTTVKITGSHLNRLPVISDKEIPKDKIFNCLEEIYKITVSAPINSGQTILKNVCNTNVDIIAARSLKKC